MERERPGQRNLAQPETYQIQYGRRSRVARAVESRGDYHAVGVRDISATEKPQCAYGQTRDFWIAGEKPDDLSREHNKQQADAAQEQHVVQSRAPDRTLRAGRLAGAQILAH